MAYKELRPKHCTQDEWKRMIDYLSAQDMQAKRIMWRIMRSSPVPCRASLAI